MPPEQTTTTSQGEQLLAELSAAAYRMARQHGCKGAFIDVELDFWYALPAAVRGLASHGPEQAGHRASA